MTQASTKNPPGRVVTTFTLSQEEYAYLKQFAKKQQRSVSAQIRFWISIAREEEEAS